MKSKVLQNILVVLGALILGNLINYGIILLGPEIISPPPGVDPSDVKSIKANAHLYTAKDFVVPFLAHAFGTLTGAFVAARFAASNYKRFALLIGVIFLIAGCLAAYMLPEFWKYSIVDITLAYIPMAILGWKLSGKPEK